MTSEWKQQFTARIAQANPTEMVVIIYDILLTYLSEARRCLTEGDLTGFQEETRKARNCFEELLESLHFAYAPAQELSKLYFYCLRLLAHANLQSVLTHREDAGKVALEDISGIEKIIVPLRDAYRQLAKQSTAGAVMDNSQEIYAGLTYGRNSLTENVADQGANRGMFA